MRMTLSFQKQASVFALKCIADLAFDRQKGDIMDGGIEYWNKMKAKMKVVPGIEPGLPESESDVITATLYNLKLVLELCRSSPQKPLISRAGCCKMNLAIHTNRWHLHSYPSAIRRDVIDC